MTVQRDTIPFVGGLFRVGSAVTARMGHAITLSGFDCRPGGGYRRALGLYNYGSAGDNGTDASGDIRGLHFYKGAPLAFRDNVGATAGQMWRRDFGTGLWSVQSLGEHLKFTSGNDAALPAEGSTITGATSGATAVVRRILINGGTFAGGNATGLYTISGRVGNFANGENLQVGGVTKAVANGTQVANTLPAGGEYELVNHNFFANSTTQRMYGVNGVGYAFEWDGTYFTPLIHGSGSVFPKHVCAHRDHLFLGYDFGTAIHSGTGNPMSWIAGDGAAELSFGNAISGFKSLTGGVLLVTTFTECYALHGANVDNWEKEKILDAGIAPYTLGETTAGVLGVMEKGVALFRPTDAFGGFGMLKVTTFVADMPVANWSVTSLYGSGPRAVSSKAIDTYMVVNRGFGTIFKFAFSNRDIVGISTFDVGTTPIAAITSGLLSETATDHGGIETILLAKGTVAGLDGNRVDIFGEVAGTTDGATDVKVVFNCYGKQPAQRKQFRRAIVDMRVREYAGASEGSGGAVTFTVKAKYYEGGSEKESYSTTESTVVWTPRITPTVDDGLLPSTPMVIDLDGTGQYMVLEITETTNAFTSRQYEMHGVTLEWSPRRELR